MALVVCSVAFLLFSLLGTYRIVSSRRLYTALAATAAARTPDGLDERRADMSAAPPVGSSGGGSGSVGSGLGGSRSALVPGSGSGLAAYHSQMSDRQRALMGLPSNSMGGLATPRRGTQSAAPPHTPTRRLTVCCRVSC